MTKADPFAAILALLPSPGREMTKAEKHQRAKANGRKGGLATARNFAKLAAARHKGGK